MTENDRNVPRAAIRGVPVESGAEAFLELLNAHGVKYIFINPGSDHVQILEAIWKYKYLGKPVPETILCLHESLAMSAAHGYFMLTEEPQVVLVHTDVGTQQVGGALHNAQRGLAGMVFCAGRSPWSPDDRSFVGHFRQEQFDQATVVRGFVKWDYELRRSEDLHHVVSRAFQIASSEPHGPVYLVLPREPLTEKMSQVTPLPRSRFGASRSPGPDPAALEESARLLVKAENPLVITSYLGRHPPAVASLVELAGALGMRVVSRDVTLNFPTDHPLWAGITADPYLPETDVILVIDEQVPYLPTDAQPAPGARIIYLDIDPVRASYPLWNFPADIRIQADSSKALPLLNRAVGELATAKDKARFQERFQRLQKEHEAQRAKWTSQAKAKAGQRPISGEWLSYCIGQELVENDIVINESISNWAALSHHLRRTRPGTIFRVNGSSLGWGLGCALGAKLAAPERTVVCLTTDGSFIYGQPVPALWAADNHKAPFLTIIFNNQGYYGVKRSVIKECGSQSYALKRSKCEELEFTPPSFARIAQGCGAWGELIEEPGALPSAIKKGLERVREGQSAVLDVWLERL